MSATFWPDLYASYARITKTPADGGCTVWALTSALDTLEALHGHGRLSDDYQAQTASWIAHIELYGLAFAGPFPLLVSNPSDTQNIDQDD